MVEYFFPRIHTVPPMFLNKCNATSSSISTDQIRKSVVRLQKKRKKKSCTFPNKVALKPQHSLLALSNLPDLSLPTVVCILVRIQPF